MANRNAVQSFRGWREEGVKRSDALAALTRALSLHREPRWMECFDISTFQGSMAVGSGVSMRDGEPDRAGYRRYRVKGVAGQDDFAMLHEVITRRLRRALAEEAMPDLLVIDGGKGQLSAALAAAKDLGVATRPDPGNPGLPFVQMVGLAKSRTIDAAALSTTRVVSRRSARSTGLAEAAERAGKGFVAEAARTPERVFLPGRKDPVVLRQTSAELYLLVRLRDEAHRFAIEFHRKLRRARTLRSGLDEIPGIGALRRKALLRHFGSLRRVREATPEEIARVEGVGEAQARAVWEFFHRPEEGRLIDDGEEPMNRGLPEESMTPPDDFPIQPIVDELCREAEPVLSGHYRMVLPSRARVISIVEDVRALFFPGYFGTQDLRGDTLSFHIGATLDRMRVVLDEEIRRAVAFAEKHDFEACPHCSIAAAEATRKFVGRLPFVRRLVASDVEAAFEGDPGAAYPGRGHLRLPGDLRRDEPAHRPRAPRAGRPAHPAHHHRARPHPDRHRHPPRCAHRRALLHRPRDRRGHRRDQRHRRPRAALPGGHAGSEELPARRRGQTHQGHRPPSRRGG